MAQLDRVGIRLSGSGGRVFLPSSSSGLTRGSLHAHSALTRATCRAATDARVKPEHDDRGNVRSHPDLNLMAMRPDGAIGINTMVRVVTRSSRAMTVWDGEATFKCAGITSAMLSFELVLWAITLRSPKDRESVVLPARRTSPRFSSR